MKSNKTEKDSRIESQVPEPQQTEYYAYRCYDNAGSPLGWFYSYNGDRDIAYTNYNLDWCKRWKTEKGAAKQFDWYNRQWQFKTKGGYLKIEKLVLRVDERE